MVLKGERGVGGLGLLSCGSVGLGLRSGRVSFLGVREASERAEI